MIKKHHEPCVLFLEHIFSEAHAERLKKAGFTVERFAVHFPGIKGKTVEQSVKDPRIIKLCDKKGWLLVTTDSSMHKTHCDLIKKTDVTILATAHNSADNMDEWVEGLIRAKPCAERHFKKAKRPWFATFTRNGEIHIQTVGQEKISRRNRPREMEPPPPLEPIAVEPLADVTKAG